MELSQPWRDDALEKGLRAAARTLSQMELIQPPAPLTPLSACLLEVASRTGEDGCAPDKQAGPPPEAQLMASNALIKMSQSHRS